MPGGKVSHPLAVYKNLKSDQHVDLEYGVLVVREGEKPSVATTRKVVTYLNTLSLGSATVEREELSIKQMSDLREQMRLYNSKNNVADRKTELSLLWNIALQPLSRVENALNKKVLDPELCYRVLGTLPSDGKSEIFEIVEETIHLLHINRAPTLLKELVTIDHVHWKAVASAFMEYDLWEFLPKLSLEKMLPFLSLSTNAKELPGLLKTLTKVPADLLTEATDYYLDGMTDVVQMNAFFEALIRMPKELEKIKPPVQQLIDSAALMKGKDGYNRAGVVVTTKLKWKLTNLVPKEEPLLAEVLKLGDLTPLSDFLIDTVVVVNCHKFLKRLLLEGLFLEGGQSLRKEELIAELFAAPDEHFEYLFESASLVSFLDQHCPNFRTVAWKCKAETWSFKARSNAIAYFPREKIKTFIKEDDKPLIKDEKDEIVHSLATLLSQDKGQYTEKSVLTVVQTILPEMSPLTILHFAHEDPDALLPFILFMNDVHLSAVMSSIPETKIKPFIDLKIPLQITIDLARRSPHLLKIALLDEAVNEFDILYVRYEQMLKGENTEEQLIHIKGLGASIMQHIEDLMKLIRVCAEFETNRTHIAAYEAYKIPLKVAMDYVKEGLENIKLQEVVPAEFIDIVTQQVLVNPLLVPDLKDSYIDASTLPHLTRPDGKVTHPLNPKKVHTPEEYLPAPESFKVELQEYAKSLANKNSKIDKESSGNEQDKVDGIVKNKGLDRPGLLDPLFHPLHEYE